MSGAAGVGGWNAQGEFDPGRYRHLLFGDRYRQVSDFLRNERSVAEGLGRLEQATQGMNQGRFRDYLATEEGRFGFARETGVITEQDDLVKASRFWLFLMRRQAIVDIGAGDADHGVLIHRVQWVLVGQWNERAGGALGPSVAIGELYQNLGAANARVLTAGAAQRMQAGWKLDTGAQGVGRIFDSVWDDVFDAFPPRQNATVPEYLRAYIQARHGALHARMRW
jgi:hypothetical protein